jgi:tryptophan synthase alpha chain
MPDRYERSFKQLQNAGRKAFIPFTLLGWPDAGRSFEIIKTFIDAGASALELGLAFSDPVADGPVIQAAAFETINSGFTFNDALTLIKRVRQYNIDIPIGLLIYYNAVLAQGADKFFQKLNEAGVDSVLIADLPPESMAEVAADCGKNAINLVCIASPMTTEERFKKIAQHAGGYLYIVSRLGITGVEERYDKGLPDLLAMARKHSSLPLCVGFGISTPEQAREMINLGADGVITGSRIIQLIRENEGSPVAEVLLPYLQSMKGSVDPLEQTSAKSDHNPYEKEVDVIST